MKFANSLAVLILVSSVIICIVGCGGESEPITKQNTGGNEIIGKDGAPMVLIPAGEFQMGDAFKEGNSDERPIHTVYLDAFYIDKYEVTNAQYKKFMDATGYKEYFFDDYVRDKMDTNVLDQPVINVNWKDAKAYADWAEKRLPTEAEWEKSARGRLAGKKYIWGNDWPPPKNSGSFADTTLYDKALSETVCYCDIPPTISDYNDGYAYSAPVGKFSPNGYGLYDMAGNVWEWCADWYANNYYANSPKTNPTGPSSGSYRVLRGGSWGDFNAPTLRVARRSLNFPANTDSTIGFRCAGLK